MNFLLKHILEPALHRLGTWLGGLLSAHGLANDDISIVMAALPVLVGFVADTIIRQVKL